ncbi:MAG: iron ABC transporter permease [Deltaproteobacteria bacterium]|nr:MAG: iron ABC transporter permease [Deltaproteobacteria bacterium]TMB39271.1 MAG: iron ABC transporter permease [Deltaproteobacteria bacterium]
MGRGSWSRVAVVLLAAAAVLAPLVIILYQSFLDGPFFQASSKLSLSAYQFVFIDTDFHRAFGSTLIVAAGMTAIAVPLGALLAFLVVRTDLPGRRWLEPALLVPIFLSPVVIAFGYVVAVGPVGFFTVPVRGMIGREPWNLYSLASVTVIAGLTHIPHVYLYASSTLRAVGADLEEAARVAGASSGRIALTISLPMVWPALLYSGVLVFFLGFELFGLPLILGDPEGLLVLSTYLYKLTNRLGVPSYQLMAVVAVVIMLIAFPLVWMQRRLLGVANRYVSVRGKAARASPLRIGGWRWAALALVLAWLAVTVVTPLAGVVLRSVVTTWGEGVRLAEVLTLDHFTELLEYPNLVRGVGNTLLIGVVGGALAVACYAAIALATHRWQSGWARVMDYLAMVPRGMPGLVAGLAFFWVFLFVKPIAPLRATPVSLWLAYSVVWLAYGMRLISSALLQISPELEEAAFTAGASRGRVTREVTLPLVRFGLLGSWLLIFLIFVREYSTGVYLLAPGSEVIGSLMVSLWATGAVDTVSALAVVNVLLVGVGLAVALRLGVRVHE